MREIKFRQWMARRKTMHYGIGIVKDGHWAGPPSVTFSVDPIMQFTGFHDRAGKEIYEGDIIKYHYFYFSNGSEIENECVCSVKWDDTFANFDAMDKDGFAHFLGQASDDGIEVIGNIYEHPELEEK